MSLGIRSSLRASDCWDKGKSSYASVSAGLSPFRLCASPQNHWANPASRFLRFWIPLSGISDARGSGKDVQVVPWDADDALGGITHSRFLGGGILPEAEGFQLLEWLRAGLLVVMGIQRFHD